MLANGLTKERMLEIEAQCIINGAVDLSGNLKLITRGGTEIDAGHVVGPQGIQGVKGDTGAQGIQGVKGDTGAQGIQGVKGDTGAQGPEGLQIWSTPTQLGTAIGDDTVGVSKVDVAGRTIKVGDLVVSSHTSSPGVLARVTSVSSQTSVTTDTVGSIRGAQGIQGATGPEGPQGPSGDTIATTMDRISSIVDIRDKDYIISNGVTFDRIVLTGTASTYTKVTVLMPADGSIISGFAGASNKTVANGCIPLGVNETLWLKTSLSSGGTGFLVTGASTTAYTAPEGAIPIVTRQFITQTFSDGVVWTGGSYTTGWIKVGASGAPAWKNGFTDYVGGTWEGVSFRRDDNVVRFKGLMTRTSGSGGAACFTLPAGFLPGISTGLGRLLMLPANGCILRFDIQPNGDVMFLNQAFSGTINLTYVSFDQVAYIAEA